MQRLAPPCLRTRVLASTAILLAAAVLAGACSDDAGAGDDATSAECMVVEVSTSPEKVDLVTTLAQDFNRTRSEVDGDCIFVNPKAKASGAAMEALASGWEPALDGPRPTIWTPASSAWGAVLDERRVAAGGKPMARVGAPLMNTPLVIAMPRPMAEALGWPMSPIGWSDLIALATSESGWAAYGHPEWGRFRLGKTSPEFSTSGLSALVAQTYAAAGKAGELTANDLVDPGVVETNRAVESSVVHYGDTTLTFLENWYKEDTLGSAMQYVSALAVEEKSVIDYNSGNPDGILQPGEVLRSPRVPLVAIYPAEGTINSDNPFFILDAPWVSESQRLAAQAFQDFVQLPENQERVLDYNFRPSHPDVAVGGPIHPSNGVDPGEPTTLLSLPEPEVMVDLLDRWRQDRKDARILLVLDVSGSMDDPASRESDETKLELAAAAAMESLAHLKPTDEVGLRVFSTGLGLLGNDLWLDPVSIAPLSQNKDELRRALSELTPMSGTPLYAAAGDSFESALAGFAPDKINAVVLLTDGRNDDGEPRDDPEHLIDLVSLLNVRTTGELGRPIRVFTIGYGADADLGVLRQISGATNGVTYNATEPSTIRRVFSAVMSHF